MPDVANQSNSSIWSKQSKSIWSTAATKSLAPAIAELKRSLDTMRNNEPINRKEHNNAQANLERDNAQSFKTAIGILGKQ